MKCPRCGLVIAGVELHTGAEYSDEVCVECEDEAAELEEIRLSEEDAALLGLVDDEDEDNES